ncbi:hypothetical protein [Thermomonospora amylolytica]|uniref:hypothetical protein n=1 Tax=Thermomonospora amylolytica TaxID=1411117 RepID=UPI000E6CA6E6|nr:hypothetical protein [Thermomonospora amylolytica]
MPVGELLARTTSPELTQWMAYERAQGGLAGGYRDEALATLIDRVNDLIHVMLAANTDKKDRDKIPEPVPYPRPGEIHQPAGG